jgi:hypothetical protein
MKHAHTCSHMLTNVHECSRMLTYTDVCWRLLTSADVTDGGNGGRQRWSQQHRHTDVNNGEANSRRANARSCNEQSVNIALISPAPANSVVIGSTIEVSRWNESKRLCESEQVTHADVSWRVLTFWHMLMYTDVYCLMRERTAHWCYTGGGVDSRGDGRRVRGASVCFRWPVGGGRRTATPVRVCILTYADVCWRMLTYSDVCWRILTYA